MMRSLVALGAAFIVVGVIIFAVVGFAPREGSRVPLIGESQGSPAAPSPGWAFAGGLALAAGAACVGIGMNRWRHAHGQTPPGDIRHGS